MAMFMLSEIKNYLKKRTEFVSLHELSSHFDIELDRMRFIMQHWIRKERVVLSHENKSCSMTRGRSCGGCSFTQATDCYKWVQVTATARIGALSVQ